MGRAIKFRAWDPVLKQMGKPFEPLTNAYTEGIFREQKAKWPEYLDADIQFMQFTGLLDKNGKEIYEGDIVQFDMPLAGKPQIRQIIYSTKHAAFVVSTGDYFPKEDWNVEVIGNIYQNPELIGVKCPT